MKKLRVLVASLGAALVMGSFPAPAQAAHHCAYPPIDDKLGIVYTAWLVCENYHDPQNVVFYIVCRVKGTC